MTDSDPIAWYSTRTQTGSAASTRALPADQVVVAGGPAATEPALVFDIGAGRDAAMLAAKGHEVVAIEPSEAMRRHGRACRTRMIASGGSTIGYRPWQRRYDWALPPTEFLSAVWQHVAPVDGPRAFRKLITLLKSGGVLAITLRHGPAEPERVMYDVSLEEIERLARAHGMMVVRTAKVADRSCPSSWCRFVM